jgi:hypothetical protein
VRRRVGAGDPDEVSRGQFLQAPGRRNLRLRPRGRIEDDADLDERAAGALAQAGSGSTTIGRPRRVLLLRRRLRSSRGCGIGRSRGQAAPHVGPGTLMRPGRFHVERCPMKLQRLQSGAWSPRWAIEAINLNI